MIKFRAWDVLARKMIRELLLISYVRNEIIGKYENGSNSIPLKIREEAILMQSTGLVDKHGQEIFEGDVLRGDDGEIFFNEVRFDEKTAKWMRNTDIELWENVELLEIIGNVYQNPELVEGL